MEAPVWLNLLFLCSPNCLAADMLLASRPVTVCTQYKLSLRVGCTGSNSNGQLGVGGSANVTEPQVSQVSTVYSWCSCPHRHASLVSPLVFCCQLHSAQQPCCICRNALHCLRLHADVQIVRRWAALSIGEAHSAGVAGDGECYTWGRNDRGQLGVAAGPPKDVPAKMDILRGWDVRAIACG